MNTIKHDETDILSEINIQSNKKPITIIKLLGLFFCILGFFLLSSYFSFLLLKPYSIRIPNFYMYSFFDSIFLTPTLGIHFFGLGGIIFIIIGACFLKKNNPLVFKKIFAFLIDGTILFFWVYLIQDVVNGQKSFHINEDIFTNNSLDTFKSELTFYDIYKTRIIVCSVFIAIYCLLGKISGGTIGERIFRLKSVSFYGNQVTIIQALFYTFYYGIGVWGVLFLVISRSDSFEQQRTFYLSLWVNFSLYFLSPIFMLFSNQNLTLAEIVSKIKTVIKISDIVNPKSSKIIE